jgi:hypothetical protein
METITNYPKLARANIIFRIEVAYLILQTIGVVMTVIALSVLYPELAKRFEEEHATKLDDGLIISAFVLLLVCYFGEMFLVFILYRAIKEKHWRKLAFWSLCQLGFLTFYAVSAIIDIVEHSHVGSFSYITTLIIVVYRSIAIKLVYDAVQELRKFPITVPFVNMRDCEERV